LASCGPFLLLTVGEGIHVPEKEQKKNTREKERKQKIVTMIFYDILWYSMVFL
jgi:hypothetical protein